MPAKRIYQESGTPITVRLPIETEAELRRRALSKATSLNAEAREVLESDCRQTHATMVSPSANIARRA